MDMNGLIFKKSKSVRDHEKTGRIITLFSNTRWCSDGLEIKCFNGEKVYVAFTLDCHDRENIGCVGSKDPLLATDIQEQAASQQPIVPSRMACRRLLLIL